MIVTIPLEAIPNQKVSVMINGQRWTVTLETRLDQLYATVENQKEGVIIYNRICLYGSFITENLFFIDMQGESNPVYTGLGTQYLLVWSDE